MSYQVSGKKQILLGLIFLGIILVVLEIGANVWFLLHQKKIKGVISF
jgi:hypothetical protein